MSRFKTNRRYIANAIVGYLVAFGVFLLAQTVYWIVYPYEVATILEPIPILNENKEIAIGERIEMRLVIEKKRDIKADVNINITCESGNLVTMTPLGRTLPVGTFDLINDNYILPPKVAEGDICQFNFLNFYQVNPLRTISQTWTSEKFKVKGER